MSFKERMERDARGKESLKESGMPSDNKVATGIVGAAKPALDRMGRWADGVMKDMRGKAEREREHRSHVAKVFTRAKQEEELKLARDRGKEAARKAALPQGRRSGFDASRKLSQEAFGVAPKRKRRDVEDFFL